MARMYANLGYSMKFCIWIEMTHIKKIETLTKSYGKNYRFISAGSFQFLALAFYCSLWIMDNGSALLPYLQFTVMGFATSLHRY